MFSFIVAIVVCIYCVVQVRNLMNDQGFRERIESKKHNTHRFPVATSADAFERQNRKPCDTQTVYCFRDNDCSQQCEASFSSLYRCINGTCRNNKILEFDGVKNECDTTKGMVAFMVGDTAFGRYEYVCKSVDLGIARSVDATNLMCRGGNIEINYVKKYPTIADCKCEYQSYVPATSVKRAHVECDRKYHDLVKGGYNLF